MATKTLSLQTTPQAALPPLRVLYDACQQVLLQCDIVQGSRDLTDLEARLCTIIQNALRQVENDLPDLLD